MALPLKKMGRDNRPEMVTMGNVQRNLLDSDYLVFPNQFMEEKMSGAYMLGVCTAEPFFAKVTHVTISFVSQQIST